VVWPLARHKKTLALGCSLCGCRFQGPAIDYLTCFMRTASYVPTAALICLPVCGLGPLANLKPNVQTNCRSAGAGRKSAQQSKHISSINGQWPMAHWTCVPRLSSMASQARRDSQKSRNPPAADTHMRRDQFQTGRCENHFKR